MKKRIMGRITFGPGTGEADARLAAVDLRAAGFSVDIQDGMEDPDDPEPGFAFMEVSCEVDAQGEFAPGSELARVLLATMGEITAIVKRYGDHYTCEDCGPVPPGHVPFKYDTIQWWPRKWH
jgi:hypothetical protein